MGLKDANIGRSLAELGRRMRLMVDRALVRIVTDSLGRQNLQVQSLADETNDDVERFQNYGFTSVPPAGSEAIVVAVGGRRGGLVAIAVEDKGSRPRGGEEGDVILYHQEGHVIVLKKNGLAEIRVKKINLIAEESCDIIGKQINITGPTSFSEDIQVKGKSFLKHFHIDGDGNDTSEPK
ncbi:TPA: phage baseplate assembly protein [Klebsiella pneumoniae]|uniref:phage baseplate assembly protein V n=1 Tax=Klebsiella TaxID=570 RepID=UPI0005C89D7A|nr:MULTISPECIES: phage baseplate assembly protein V [Klebsiella/Raoultella group]QLT63903.1 phage baseplate assembly protein [Klebsiella oxytoca]DAL98381.1 MAG TPA: baseplate assembly protein V [Caudoviricetes sp.]KIZ44254.1 phage baseplate protein [Raoultella ornithinolytica]MBR7436809.1 phage baseplate assembly protein V [Klebsiella pneumoniae]MCJ7051345.1 phage baseplate assembly protein V [Klebsiella variicola]